jgi:hypothetical protein
MPRAGTARKVFDGGTLSPSKQPRKILIALPMKLSGALAGQYSKFLKYQPNRVINHFEIKDI